MSALSVNPDVVTSETAASPEARAASGEVRVQFLRDWDSVTAIEREWDDLAERSNAEISSCPAYARAWWKHYGRGKLAIIACRRGERLVGVLPMFIDRIGPWPIGVKIARLIGCDSTIAVMVPAVEVEHATDVIRAATAELLEREECDVVHFGPMQGDTPEAEAIRRAGEQERSRSGATWNLRERRLGVFTRWDLPATFDEYLASLDKSDRSNLKRNLNKIAKAPGSRVRVVTQADESRDAFDRFVPMHAKQWEAEGKPGHFGDWPRSESLVRDAIAELSKVGRVAFVEQDIEGECVCSYWSYVLGKPGGMDGNRGGRAFWRLPARAVGEKWDPYALGRVGLVMMLRELIGMGVRYVDGGPGHYDYKLRLGATEHPLVAFMLVRPSAVAGVKATLLAKYADLVNLVYYRAWRLKFAPRLGWKSKALIRLWVRSRV